MTARETGRNGCILRWGRILLGALLAEGALFVLAIALYIVPAGAAMLVIVIPPASFVATLLSGFWVARKAASCVVLHGALVGVAAALIYIALTWGKDLPTAYTVADVLKVIGGALGGWLAAARMRP